MIHYAIWFLIAGTTLFIVIFFARFIDWKRYPMEGTVLFFGKLGQGKTYGMVRECQFAFRYGIPVYSNIPIKPCIEGADFHLLDAADIIPLMRKERGEDEPDIVVALDEAWILFDSYLMLKMDRNMRVDLASLRKNRISLYMTAQRVTSVHKAARELINYFMKCETISIFGFRVFRLTPYDLSGSGELRDDPDEDSQRYFFSNSIAGSYDTMRSIRKMFLVE